MYSTREIIKAFKEVNPEKTITEDLIRHVIRRGSMQAPALFAGRYVWTNAVVEELARHLGLKSPKTRQLVACRKTEAE